MSTSGIASEVDQAPLKAAAMSFRDEQKRVEWPKTGTPLGKEHEAFSERTRPGVRQLRL